MADRESVLKRSEKSHSFWFSATKESGSQSAQGVYWDNSSHDSVLINCMETINR